MKCFRHRDSDAVGLCKSCSKGVCPECAQEVGLSIACKETCVAEVASLDDQINRARVTMSAQKNNRMYMPTFFIVLGAIFIGLTVYKTGTVSAGAIPGIAFAGFGIALWLINRKWIRDMDKA